MNLSKELQCQAFLANFFSRNPSLAISIYGSEIPPFLLTDIADPVKWELQYSSKPGCGNYSIDVYDIYDINVYYNRMHGDRTSKRSAKYFVMEYGFFLDVNVYDSGVGFIVLEDKAGKLHLGSYIGD